MDGDVWMPKHAYLPDGRLLCWYHRESDDHVEGFQLTVDADTGVGPIDLEQGLALLAELGVGHDGRPMP